MKPATIDQLQPARPPAHSVPLPHVFLGIIARHVVTVSTFMTALRLANEARSLGFRVSCGVEETGGIALARNLLAETFYDRITDAGWFLSFDDDVGRLSARDLLRMLQQRVDVIGAPLPGRAVQPEAVAAALDSGHLQAALTSGDTFKAFLGVHESLSPLIVNYLPGGPVWHGPDLVEVAGTSAGCLLISRNAVAKMIDAHGRGTFTEGNGRARSFPRLFNFTDDTPDDSYSFCARWRELGGKVYVDARTTLTHRGVTDFTTRSLGDLLHVASEASPLVLPT